MAKIKERLEKGRRTFPIDILSPGEIASLRANLQMNALRWLRWCAITEIHNLPTDFRFRAER